MGVTRFILFIGVDLRSVVSTFSLLPDGQVDQTWLSDYGKIADHEQYIGGTGQGGIKDTKRKRNQKYHKTPEQHSNGTTAWHQGVYLNTFSKLAGG